MSGDLRVSYKGPPELKVPDHWQVVMVKELGEVVTGSTPSKQHEEYFGGNIPFFKPTDLNDGYNVRSYHDSLTDEGARHARILPPKAVLVTCIGATIGKTGLSRVACATNQQINALVPNVGYVLPEWCYWAFCSSYGQEQITSNASATTLPILNKRNFERLHVPLAPLTEQRRIVAKIEELFSDLDAGVAALTRAKANLKRYRASVLKAAVEGRLTAAWRAEHPDTEPASALLARILTERRKKWEADQLAKFAAAGKSPPKNWKDKYPEPSPPDTTNLPQLPKGWCWASVAQVASEDDYSLAIGPFGSNLKVSDYTQRGVPLVFVRNIRSGRFNDEGCKFVSSEKASQLDAHSVEGGDVLITKMGDPPGDACLYPRNLPKAIITADCIKVRLHDALPLSEYFVDAINSAVVQSQIQGITKGVAQQKVSLGRFSTVAIPLPPVTEQAEVVSAVSETFSQIKDAETQIEHGLLRAARLRQSILKQAFEGKLVPQDPADEPTSVLLNRVCEDGSSKMRDGRRDVSKSRYGLRDSLNG